PALPLQTSSVALEKETRQPSSAATVVPANAMEMAKNINFRMKPPKRTNAGHAGMRTPSPTQGYDAPITQNFPRSSCAHYDRKRHLRNLLRVARTEVRKR